MAYIYLVIALTINSLANILLKEGASKGVKLWPISFPEFFTNNYLFLIGVVCFAINVVFYFLALKNLPLSVAYPIMVGASFILVNAYSLYFINEKIVALQIVGFVLILAGILMVLFPSR